MSYPRIVRPVSTSEAGVGWCNEENKFMIFQAWSLRRLILRASQLTFVTFSTSPFSPPCASSEEL